MNRVSWAIAVFAPVLWLVSACGGDDDGGGPTTTGASCQAATDCFPGVAMPLQGGDAVCMDKVPGGYCTHHCGSDADCCAVAGECPNGRAEVCAPFENTSEMFCFLSCEEADYSSTNYDASSYCGYYAGSAFSCRSTGGGSQNRQICSP